MNFDNMTNEEIEKQKKQIAMMQEKIQRRNMAREKQQVNITPNENIEELKINENLDNTINKPIVTEIKKFNVSKSNNPLLNHIKRFKTYVQLPTMGKFLDEEIQFSDNFRIGILPMTIEHEMMLKIPESLFNGDTMYKIVHDCVPSIKNTRNISLPDFEILMLAIRMISFGDQLDMDVICPHCKHENTIGYSINTVLNTITEINEKIINIDNLTISLKPYSYEISNKLAILVFTESKFLDSIIENKDENIEERGIKINESLSRLISNNKDCFAISTNYIKINENDDIITDTDMIREFYEEIDISIYKSLEKAFSELNNSGFERNIKTNCTNCSGEIITPITYDPTSFFA